MDGRTDNYHINILMTSTSVNENHQCGVSLRENKISTGIFERSCPWYTIAAVNLIMLSEVYENFE